MSPLAVGICFVTEAVNALDAVAAPDASTSERFCLSTGNCSDPLHCFRSIQSIRSIQFPLPPYHFPETVVLYLVPTPIGNLEDITYRAVRVLSEVDLIACEDTRTSGVLLSHYDVDTPTTSYHEHNERKKAPQLVARLRAGQDVALISDAGSPGISDPGFYLARECWNAGVQVTALPGPTAFVPALTASALPSDRFVFEGFLPKKKGRQTRLSTLADETRTVILYEAPYRLVRTLEDLADHCGPERSAVVVRELTKKFEEIERGTLESVRSYFATQEKVRGECVIVVGGAAE